MALVDVGTGTGGTFTDDAGNNITWTSTANHGFTNVAATNMTTGALFNSSSGMTYTFDDGSGGGVENLTLQIGGLTLLGVNRDIPEEVDLTINGVDVNLATLIANGDAQIVPSEQIPGHPNYDSGNNQAGINGDGDVVGATAGNPEDQILINFNIEITTITLATNQTTLSDIYSGPICFTRGTLIETQSGPVPIEEIAAGDLVCTMDRGLQPVRWIGSTKVQSADLVNNPKLHPIRITAEALGLGLPKRDMWVSRQHRMVVSSDIADRMCDGDVLIPAIKLTELPGIFTDDSVEGVEYFHMLFDQHEVVFAEGAPSESLFTGPEALKSISPEARAEIFALFPDLQSINYISEPALPFLPLKQQKKLVSQHVANKTPLLENYRI